MPDKSHAAGAAGRTPTAGQPESVRNVVLVGHSGAGKTTLAEALLGTTGTIQREGRVEDGSTVSDFDEVEVRQGRSVNLTLVPFVHGNVKVNLLDTPGYADFTGEIISRGESRRDRFIAGDFQDAGDRNAAARDRALRQPFGDRIIQP